jgi:GIY-YIG catalytic domain-containing protein
MTTVEDLAADAITQLGIGASPVTAGSVDSWPNHPGLYAVYASADVWRMLRLDDPPDRRPVYVGKAERSLSSRDVGTHFGFARKTQNSVTGSSTLRRSLSALLRTELGFRGRYRNPGRRDKASHFGLSREHDAALSEWMRGNLLATYWEMPTRAVSLGDVETAVLRRLTPPLNIQKVSHEWTKQVKQARSVMAADCADDS